MKILSREEIQKEVEICEKASAIPYLCEQKQNISVGQLASDGQVYDHFCYVPEDGHNIELEQLESNCKFITRACNNYYSVLKQLQEIYAANDFLHDEITQLTIERDNLKEELDKTRKDLEAQQRISFNSNRNYDF